MGLATSAEKTFLGVLAIAGGYSGAGSGGAISASGTAFWARAG